MPLLKMRNVELNKVKCLIFMPCTLELFLSSAFDSAELVAGRIPATLYFTSSSTLNLTPYTLHRGALRFFLFSAFRIPTSAFLPPYALCPTPYAPFPMPRTLCPTPYALCPLPYALCPVPYALRATVTRFKDDG
jgi:hypothetical protein